MSLEALALSRFDQLVASGDLLWQDVPPRYHPSTPFSFEFRVAASLISKPQDKQQIPTAPVPSSTTATTATKQRGAFDDENSLFEILPNLGPHHRLILNKFSVVRPQFVIPTKNFEPQQNPLNAEDFAAIWQVLMDLPEEGSNNNKYMGIFNCGVNAGSSVGHKHLQVIPLPETIPEDENFLALLLKHIHESEETLQPENKKNPATAAQTHFTLPKTPFKHAAHPLNPSKPTSPETLLEIWNHLCNITNIHPGTAHNLLLTREIMVAIPRPKAWMGSGAGEFAANAACMAGMVWCKTEEQYNAWMEFGPMKALGEFGVGVDS
ncbi:uncharacterized protein RCC_03663 [Ramularia collo-cygni]|uniref:Uncharacterized protein n=1 Tax=Ramularia collo-cygni TaxID=112498 RepID=A0A2D3UZJ8_9PEZI|nr:uncharacterized protein RCC_03663 [Ramularia collo-cygni]CZT17827.1 uncharacterized protein RCC_03663 [Ramularia collo-cygni]